MTANNFIFYGTKIIAGTVLDIAYFPLWWYSRGLAMIISKLAIFLSSRQQTLALFVWLKNIYRPMYGQSDWQGVLISIFMRIVQVILRAIAMLFWLGLSLVLLGAWSMLPPLIVYEIFCQFN